MVDENDKVTPEEEQPPSRRRRIAQSAKDAGKRASEVAGYVGGVASESAGLAVHVAARGSRRTGGAAADAAGRTAEAASEAASSATSTAGSVGAVLTGADIRAFDDFTDAITRVVVGIHEDVERLRGENAALKQRVAELESRTQGLAPRGA